MSNRAVLNFPHGGDEEAIMKWYRGREDLYLKYCHVMLDVAKLSIKQTVKAIKDHFL